MAWVKPYLDNIAAMQQINSERLDAVLNAYSYQDIFKFLNNMGSLSLEFWL